MIWAYWPLAAGVDGPQPASSPGEVAMNDAQWSSDLISPRNVAGAALLGKACDILELIGRSPGLLGQPALSRRTGIPRATLYRILAALVARGLVRADPVSQNYTLGFTFLELAQNAWSSSDLASIASVELRRLRDLTGETAYLAVQEGDHVLSLGRFESAHDTRSSARLGVLKPMHCTSQGKAILAHLPECQRDQILGAGLAAFTDRTIVDPDRLRAHLAIVRARGYAIDDEEIVVGTRCVGAAILDPGGKPLAAISVAGPTFRMHPGRAEQLGKELVEATRRIAAQVAPASKPASHGARDCRAWTRSPAFAGACPRWDAGRRALVWADLLAPAIRVQRVEEAAAAEEETVVSLHALSERIGALCPVEDGFVFSVGGDVLIGSDRGVRARLARVEGHVVQSLRAAPGGAIWAAAFDAESGLTRIGPLSAHGGLGVSFELQGEVSDIAFAGERGLFATVPSRQCVYLLEPDTGRKRRFADIPRVAGAPCALAIDRRLDPWVGLSDGWSIVGLDENGEIARTVALPVPNPTGIAFGGAGLSAIFVTSARAGLSGDSLANAPLCGQLLSIDVGERGLPEAAAGLRMIDLTM